MDNYVAIVFDNDTKAYDGLHALWNLDAEGDITVHGAAVIHRDSYGYTDVATKDTDPGVRTAIGIGLGALLGALAGPIGATAGAAAAAAAGTGAAIGAASGGVVGLTADAAKADEHEQAAFEGGFVLPKGKSAVIAEVSEQWTTPIDTLASRLGGSVYRRSKSDIKSDMWFGSDYPEYLYPYDYEPQFA
ncbi:MAG: hypothetical protein JO190_11840 [Candidatus Eremiobacteraeota bacterium]|nr:hypothetical protein [Candidatus Eremiobacteraeota bacterium]MBV8424744.1 hypothetical protein [Candidatus Eremiobacteraeota bacterium]